MVLSETVFGPSPVVGAEIWEGDERRKPPTQSEAANCPCQSVLRNLRESTGRFKGI